MAAIIETELKLNLGCRDKHIPGFKSVDINGDFAVDQRGTIADLWMYKSGSVSEIYCSHALEHLPHKHTLDALKEWHRLLKPSGILYVAVPDFDRTVELYLKTKAEGVGLTDWMVNYIHGDQCYPEAYHYASFDFLRLRKLLFAAGFSEASQVELFPVFAANDCSTKTSTMDGKPISLNIVAVK